LNTNTSVSPKVIGAMLPGLKKSSDLGAVLVSINTFAAAANCQMSSPDGRADQVGELG